MKKYLFQQIIGLISISAICSFSFAGTPNFNSEKSFNFTINPKVIEAGGIQMYSNYHSLDQVRANSTLKTIDHHNILQQNYGSLGNVLISKELFLIKSPISELEKNIYKQPSVQSVLFPGATFYDCNATSCNAKQTIMGTVVHFTAFYTYIKNPTEKSISIDQFGTQWSQGFNNTISYSTASAYNATTTLITSYQILILKGGTGLVENKVSNELKKQIIDFHGCFESGRCQK
jgi:hypothetical protein